MMSQFPAMTSSLNFVIVLSLYGRFLDASRQLRVIFVEGFRRSRKPHGRRRRKYVEEYDQKNKTKADSKEL